MHFSKILFICVHVLGKTTTRNAECKRKKITGLHRKLRLVICPVYITFELKIAPNDGP
jgi:hypothetical protein